MIREFVHGTNTRLLFSMVGEWVASRIVHKAVGGAITSEEGDLWLVAIVEDSGPRGFAQMRLSKDGATAHLRCVYADNAKINASLIRHAAGIAKVRGAEVVTTTDRKTATVWKDAGFTKRASRTRGEFVRWEKVIEGESK